MRKYLALTVGLLLCGYTHANAAAGITASQKGIFFTGNKTYLLNTSYQRYHFWRPELKRFNTDMLIVLKTLYGEHLIGMALPPRYREVTIAGKGEVTKQQAIAFIKIHNFKPSLECSVEKLVELYHSEASREGIKWDIALCQALLETGFFRYGGTVVPEQNNYCGLGTTSATVRGAYFLSPQLGVRAHIQHLLAYTRAKKPLSKIVDPRYYLVHNNKRREGFFTTWYELNGKWATGGEYCEKILGIYESMKKVIAFSACEK